MPVTLRPTLSRGERVTLEAVVRTVLPHLPDAPAHRGVLALVEDRIRSAPLSVSHDLSVALRVLGSPMAQAIVTGRWRRFGRLSGGEREGTFQQWAVSAIPLARSVHQALRRLILSTWYATPEGRAEIGVRPPLHQRSPAVDWEGPVEGEAPLDSEPVARRPHAAHVPGAKPEPRPIPAAVVTADSLRGEVRLKADVVVIGSGAGGAVAAARFAEAGREVVIIEIGDYLHAPDFTEDEGTLVPRLYADQALRTTVDGSISLLQGGAVGGGTTVNWMLMLRPPERTLADWVRMGITGFTMRDLAPHLDRVEQEVHARMTPADAHAPSNLALLDGARHLGWRASAARINARGCVRAGTCSLGCRYDAKQGGLLTYLPRAFSAGARLYANARVRRIEVMERNRAGGTPPLKRVTAEVSDSPTRQVHGTLVVDAPIVVLAAGAVGTPVILEQSGLGGGGVGRYLWLHPTTGVMGRYPRETYPLAGIPQTALCDEFLHRDANGHGFWIECPALQPALAAAALPGFGPLHREAMRQLANTVAFIVLVRDGSGTDRSMGSVWVDRHGFTRIRYAMSAGDRFNAQLGAEAAARLHLAAGATDVQSLHTPPVTVRRETDIPAIRAASVAPNRGTWFSAHVNGTCRLGVNPATSGVTPHAERHGVRGLYVCDGSLLPTSLGVNPQETIMAMASLVVARAIG
jgi:choline dehydrogenase-like flavoprotein